MKKHQLLEKAMRDYQAGTSYTALGTHSKVFSDGVFYFSSEGTKILQTENGIAHSVYDGQRWAPTLGKQVKPNEVKVPLRGNSRYGIISNDSIFIDLAGHSFKLNPSDIEDMAHALKSLQP